MRWSRLVKREVVTVSAIFHQFNTRSKRKLMTFRHDAGSCLVSMITIFRVRYEIYNTWFFVCVCQSREISPLTSPPTLQREGMSCEIEGGWFWHSVQITAAVSRERTKEGRRKLEQISADVTCSPKYSLRQDEHKKTRTHEQEGRERGEGEKNIRSIPRMPTSPLCDVTEEKCCSRIINKTLLTRQIKCEIYSNIDKQAIKFYKLWFT